ncbi:MULTISPECIES: glycosyltransferase family 2 protein [unclassified Mesorhizobium]|uniref:glycosyltransferase family 2 protein n=1 Tax=unclassified Mesorhizobium TaxID=325217 RepID=UPI000FE8A5A2|nr:MULTISPECIES: glycosyltransferase [unclassified Mesorhizobium]RWI14729.1 MAG: glycosyltransferase [Mesorhizobium sp.]RWK47312.1 MAG: glycosyltransferase [Mesorhizobium sp.]RWK94683.1 MAG: glycosyltransferase [Mesorhizobium sp.]RWL13275.1 MAG: glycosyltransferase [Mesorhizobium sp.]TIP61059.1 MAG: glycosyltransferase [Mesorhizobium sp.]
MGYRLVEIELSKPLAPIELAPQHDGVGLIARWQDRLIGFEMIALPASSVLSAERLKAVADERFADRILVAKVDVELSARRRFAAETALPNLSIAICTKDRAKRLSRLLSSLDPIRWKSAFQSVEIVVVDNASVDATTREAVECFKDVRYVFEPKAGLDFARNAALRAATGDLVAYLDDDVVVDRNWLAGLAKACRYNPGAGGFTGLVLPFRLDTEAQIFFEQNGGFGRGFVRKEFHNTRFDNPLHPVGSGSLGAGCNMAFDRALLVELGGFDEALDTGSPLPGGGDLDIFYRVLRSRRPMIYEPEYAVYHEHRETIEQLRRQYWTWGLGMMAFLVKSRRTDEELSARHRAMVRWWFFDRLKAVARAARRFRGRDFRFGIAELWGGIYGLAGEYDRSRARVQTIREQNQ